MPIVAGRSTESLGVTGRNVAEQLNNSALFPIAASGATAAALIGPLWIVASGSGFAGIMPASIILMFGFPVFLVALLIPIGLSKFVARFAPIQWLRWAILPGTSAAIGYALPMIVGFALPLSGRMGAVAGLIGGAVSAVAWEYFERHPERGNWDPSAVSNEGAKGDA
jgi:hypothetical protein